MRHVHHERRLDRIGDRAEALEIPMAGIGRAAGDDQLRPMLSRQGGDRLHVEAVIVRPHAVGHRLEPFAGHVDRRAVREVAARRKVEPHERVARLKEREEDGLVRLAAGVRLHVGEAAVEEPADALDGEALGDVDEMTAAVIALARIAFGVFVRHDRALRLEHGAGHDVFGRDELDLVALAAEFAGDRRGDLGIGLLQAGRKEAVRQASLVVGGGLAHSALPDRRSAPRPRAMDGRRRTTRDWMRKPAFSMGPAAREGQRATRAAGAWPSRGRRTDGDPIGRPPNPKPATPPTIPAAPGPTRATRKKARLAAGF